MTRRTGLTLLETLVTIAIVMVLLAITLPAIQHVRALALRVTCLNNLRQIGVAIHNHASERRGRVPSIDEAHNREFAGFLCCILPYIEHGDFYAEVQSGQRPMGNDYEMKPFLCPADPSLRSYANSSLTSYAANAEAFNGQPSLPGSFRDGVSNTIAFAEHYAHPISPTGWYTQFDWCYGSLPLEIPTNQMTLRRATFADKASGDAYPVTQTSPPQSSGSIPGLIFQVRPRLTDCDPRVAQTGHPGGMSVLMADAAVRTLRGDVAPAVYWALVTPNGGEQFGIDW
jgi:hypothetical protein